MGYDARRRRRTHLHTSCLTTTRKAGGVMARRGANFDDVEKLHKAFKQFQVRLPDAGDKVLEATSRKIATQGRSKLSSRPGSRGDYKRMPQHLNQATIGGHHGIELQRGGTMIAAEYGTTFHWVFGTRVVAKSMKRRVFGARVKRWTSGKVVGKLIKAELPKTERELAIAFDKQAERIFDKAGL